MTISEIVKGIMRREKDLAGTNFLLYESIAKDIWKELNLEACRLTERRFVKVDKRTNSITLPNNYLKLSSICEIDSCGKQVPLVINTNITSDIIDVSGISDCGCECGCESELCSSVKNYELIQEDIEIAMPDNTIQVFTGTLRKKINRDGSYVTEKIWPTKKYDNGTYTAVVMESTEEFLCKVELLPCGCVKPTPENEDKIVACSGADSYQIDCGCNINPDFLMRPEHIHHPQYNFSEEGDRITSECFYKCDYVLARYYVNNKTKDILVPYFARKAIATGIKLEAAEYDKKQIPAWQKARWEQNNIKARRVLMDKLNEVNLTSFLQSALPHRRMV
jgi:hypothetical protein